MCELRYPVGMQTFSKIIEHGYVYVDKTHYIKPLLKQGQFIFMSRPRRFGKSLLLSTLEAYFDGRRDHLLAVGLNDRNPLPLMFQTGYLTIADYNEDTQLYELRFPNREVEKGFYEQLLNVYVPDTSDPFSPFDFTLFRTDLAEGRPEDFMQRLATMLKHLPYEDHNEPAYRAITFLIAVLSGTRTLAENHGYKGRSDIEAFTGRYIFIFEFKYNKSVEEALEQIRERDYAGRYAMDSRQVYLIAANFTEDKDNRSLQYEIEQVKTT